MPVSSGTQRPPWCRGALCHAVQLLLQSGQLRRGGKNRSACSPSIFMIVFYYFCFLFSILKFSTSLLTQCMRMSCTGRLAQPIDYPTTTASPSSAGPAVAHPPVLQHPPRDNQGRHLNMSTCSSPPLRFSVLTSALSLLGMLCLSHSLSCILCVCLAEQGGGA